MASKGLQTFSRSLSTLRSFSLKDPLTQCLAPQLSRSMATETATPLGPASQHEFIRGASDPLYEFSDALVPTTIYDFPSMEPLRLEDYKSKHLYLPLRRDILHRAVVFEADAARHGTASTKTRREVHGSHRKIRPQKGTGHARLGTKQSPMLKGGGKSFGPHPRDFSTDLPKKIYDLAWRTALSWRYRRGQLIVCEDDMDLAYPSSKFLNEIFLRNSWGGKGLGLSLLITLDERGNLYDAFDDDENKVPGKVQTPRQTDVRDLLGGQRVIIEKSALDLILEEHQSDLVSKVEAIV